MLSICPGLRYDFFRKQNTSFTRLPYIKVPYRGHVDHGLYNLQFLFIANKLTQDINKK